MGLWTEILDLLFPPRCAFCRKLLRRGESGMCAGGEVDLPYTKGGGKQKGDFVNLCVSPLYYEGNVREALLRYKFKGATANAVVFGRLLADCAREHLAGEYDLISWVPLSGRRLRERGYDQAMLLAMAVALELDDVAVEVLKKNADVAPQSETGGAEKRRGDISGAYETADPELIAGKRILLIDDIVTTGSTFSECARTLGLSGADSVVCAAVARSRD
ncbi:MAG TPA: amidophosphoribosyltransferase [Clostridiales bacterium]|nr:amidophosphoribosyltransferase [Clostridiales bacterium]